MDNSEKRKEYLRKRRAQVCESCGGPKEISGYCKECWEKRTKRRKELFAEKKKRGECISCKNKTNGKSKCETCLSKQRKQREKREFSRLGKGLCVLCGNRNHTENSKTCGDCFCRRVSKFHFKTYAKTSELLELLENQNHTCPYTGKKLILGENCTLDHIVPKSRGGINEVDNLQWVFCSEFVNVNTLKWNMTDQEFKGLIKIVYEHTTEGGNGS